VHRFGLPPRSLPPRAPSPTGGAPSSPSRSRSSPSRSRSSPSRASCPTRPAARPHPRAPLVSRRVRPLSLHAHSFVSRRIRSSRPARRPLCSLASAPPCRPPPSPRRALFPLPRAPLPPADTPLPTSSAEAPPPSARPSPPSARPSLSSAKAPRQVRHANGLDNGIPATRAPRWSIWVSRGGSLLASNEGLAPEWRTFGHRGSDPAYSVSASMPVS
jgi:hypothetical protein